MSALDAIRAKLAAQKAGNAGTPPPAPKPAALQPAAPATVVAPATKTLPAANSAALSILERAKLARSAGTHSGAAVGVGTSQVAEVSVMQPAQKVLSAQEQQLAKAQEVLQQKKAAGFYSVDAQAAAKLPPELPADVVESKLLELDAALIMRTPQLKSLLVDINRNLRQFDELAYLLRDEQLGLIVQSNLTIAGAEISSGSATGSKRSASAGTVQQAIAATKDLDLDDI